MNKQFAQWYNKAHVEATNETLESRWRSVKEAAEAIEESDIFELSRIYHQISVKDDNFTDKFIEFFFNSDKTFPTDGENVIELQVLAGLTLHYYILGYEPEIATPSAFAITCPYLRSKRDSIIPELPEEAEKHLTERSLSFRNNLKIDKLPDPSRSISKFTADIKKSQSEAPDDTEGIVIKYLEKIASNLKTVTTRTNTLIDNQKLLREESDILWFTFGGYSNYHNQLFSEFEAFDAAIYCGAELADLVQYAPGPFAYQAFIEKILSATKSNNGSEQSINKYISNLDEPWKKKYHEKYSNNQVLDLCPVILCITKSAEKGLENTWPDAVKSIADIDSNEQLSPLNLSMQVYQEIMFLNLME